MAESIQHKLDRVRPPRVQITYDVEIGDAIQKKELPFVAGVIADLSGKGAAELPAYKERRFVSIDRDNFNQIIESFKPRVAYQVKNVLQPKQEGEEDTYLNASLSFNHIDDFEPMSLVNQIEPLKKLYDVRVRLKDLIAKLDGNSTLESLLSDAIKDKDKLTEIKKLADDALTE